MAEVQELEPQAIYLVAYVDVMAEVLAELQAAGFESPCAWQRFRDRTVDRDRGRGGREPGLSTAELRSRFDDRLVAAFVSAYRAKYNRDPDIYAAHGYDALKLIVKAMRDTGFSLTDEVRRGLNNIEEGYVGAAG